MPECGICGIKFSNKENLMKHCRIHREKVGYPGTPDPARINRQNRKKRFTFVRFYPQGGRTSGPFTGTAGDRKWRACRIRTRIRCKILFRSQELHRLPEHHPLNGKRQLRPMSPGTPAKKTRKLQCDKGQKRGPRNKGKYKTEIVFQICFYIFNFFRQSKKKRRKRRLIRAVFSYDNSSSNLQLTSQTCAREASIKESKAVIQ